MLVFGFHAVASRLRRQAGSVKELYVDARRDDGRMRELLAVAAQAGVEPRRVDAARLDRLCPNRRHQGVVAIAESRPPVVDFDGLLDAIDGPPLLLLLDGVTDPRNLGACLRVADGAGAHGVIAPKDHACPLNEAAIQTASGAAESEAWRRWIAERYEPLVLRAVGRAGRAQDGAAALLARLRAAGLRLGMVSDYRGADDRLRAIGIDPGVFHFRLVTEEVGAMKPAARVAALTLEGMGLPGERMVMVGDRAFADERFAEACSMGFLGVLAGGAPAGPGWMPWSQVHARLSGLAG